MARNFVMGATINLKSRGFMSGIRKTSRGTSMFSKETKAADKSVKGFGGTMTKAKTWFKKYSTAGKEAAGSTKRFGKEAKGLGGTLRGVKGLVAAFVGSMAIKGASKWLVGANADMETYRNTLTVVMGSQEKAIEQLAWAEKFAATTPFEIPGIVEATTRLEAYGLSSKKVLGITGDMASVMGKDLMQAVEAVADAQTGEVERLKEFGITKKMISDQAKLMGVSAVNAKGQITDMTAFNAALFTIMEKNFSGGMAMQAKTFKGMISNAKDFAGRIGRKLGAPLFDKAKEQLQLFLVQMQKLEADGTIDKWIENVQKTVGKFAENVGKFFRFIMKNKEVILSTLTGVVTAFAAFKVISFVVGFMGMLQSAALILVPAILAISWPVVAVAAVLGVLAGGFMYAWRNSERFRDIVTNAATVTRDFLVNAFTVTVEFIGNAVDSIVTFVTNMVTGFVNGGQAVSDFFWDLDDKIMGFIDNAKESGIKIMHTMADGIKAGAMKPINAVKSAFAKIREMMPFSDAHTGPLSDLTLSGSRVMTTFGEGIASAEGAPAAAVGQSFSNVPPSLDGLKIPVAGAGTSVTNNTVTAPIQFAEGSVVIHVKQVTDMDSSTFKNKIVKIIYDAAKSASDVLSNGSLEVVL